MYLNDADTKTYVENQVPVEKNITIRVVLVVALITLPATYAFCHWVDVAYYSAEKKR